MTRQEIYNKVVKCINETDDVDLSYELVLEAGLQEALKLIK